MVIKNIIQVGNPKLRQISKPVLLKDINSPMVKRIIKNLKDTMVANNLVGIAAPQIGHNYRIFITELKETKYRKMGLDPLRIYINPKIIWLSEETVVEYEGCGSVAYAKIFGPVSRHKKLIIEALDEHSNKFHFKANDVIPWIIQHEFDHLNGIVFSDKIVDYKKILSYEEYVKARKEKRIK